MSKNTLVCICGPSGVGKTTVSRLICMCLGYEDSVVISGDDSHKWERGDENWKFTTHLNPDANNLLQEFESLKSLKENKKISRKIYNHSSGKFDDETFIFPKKYIIYEGLHAMYGEISELSDISIYINVDDSIKREWKIERDSQKRGYGIYDIIKSIDKRRSDEEKYIEPQKKSCNLVINVFKEQDKIKMSFDYKDKSLISLVNKFKKIYEAHCSLIGISKKISKNKGLCQSKGGNISFSFDNIIAISNSGVRFSDISFSNGFGYHTYEGTKMFEDNIPSMEASVHKSMGGFCLHTHPINLMSILCSKECDSILESLYSDYHLSNCKIPGEKLSEDTKNKKTVFVKNHGLFVSRSSLEEAYEKTIEIEEVAKNFLRNKCSEFLYPDALVLEEENSVYHSHVLKLIKENKLTPNFLSEEEKNEILNLKEEKYRKEIK